MKFLVVFACALAAASASFVAPGTPFYPGPQHLPVIGPNGVPVDTPAVQDATAAHLTHKVEAHARNGDFIAPVVAAPVAYAHHHAIAAPVAYPHHHTSPSVAAIAGPAAYPTTAVYPSSVNGVPLETPEVVAAKTKHFAAHAEALARTGHFAAVGPIAPIHHLHRRGIYTPFAYSAYAYGAYPYVGYASPYYY